MTLLREAVARAINAHTLLADPAGDPTALLGGLAFCDSLGVALWRWKYGGDHSQAPTAVRLLADTIRSARRFSRWHDARSKRRAKANGVCRDATPADLADRVAAAVLAEWCADRCPGCHGKGTLGGEQHLPAKRRAPCKRCSPRGKNEAASDGQKSPGNSGAGTARAAQDPWRYWPRSGTAPVRSCSQCGGTGHVEQPVDAAAPRLCGRCKGSGRAPVQPNARAVMIGISLALYRARWEPVFAELLARLDAFDFRVQSELRGQLRSPHLQSDETAGIVRAIRQELAQRLIPASAQAPIPT